MYVRSIVNFIPLKCANFDPMQFNFLFIHFQISTLEMYFHENGNLDNLHGIESAEWQWSLIICSKIIRMTLKRTEWILGLLNDN